MKLPELFGDSVLRAAQTQAMADYPREACGLVIDGCYQAMDNVAKDPEKHFQIEGYPTQGLQAVIHSHPDGEPLPSAADMQGQLDMGVAWGVLACKADWASPITWFGDPVPKAPLIGRPFVHGLYDCYSLLRDFFLENYNVTLLEFPRNDLWWLKDQDLLTRQNFEMAGFSEIARSDLREGDVILGGIESDRVNHCAIYIGQGLILHHLYNRLSRRDPFGPWDRFARHYLRHETLA